MRLRCLTLITILLSGNLTACTEIRGVVPIRLDATAPAVSLAPHSINTNRKVDMDHQVDLVALIVSDLQRDGDTSPNHWTFVNTVPDFAKSSDSRTVYLGGRDGEALDRLVPVVGKSPRAKEIRNDVASALIAASTTNCVAYLKSLRGEQVGSRLAFDLLSGGFATAGAITPAGQTTKILSGLSALSTAEASSVDRNIFAQQAAETIADAIMKVRDEDSRALQGKMGLSYEQWPLGIALADIFEFHYDCSVTRGLSHVSGALQQREQSVRAIRAAAAEAERNPELGAALLQVVSNLESAPDAEILGAPDLDDWKGDLQRVRDTELACMDDIEKTFSNDTHSTLAAVIASHGDCTAPAGLTDWANLVADVNATLKGSAGVQPLTAPAAGSNTADEVKDFRARASALFIALKQNYADQANSKIDAHAAGRAGLAQALRHWESNGGAKPADQALARGYVYVFIRSFAGLRADVPASNPPLAAGATAFSGGLASQELQSLDPVMAYAVAAAFQAKEDTSVLADDVALQALAAGQGRYRAMASKADRNAPS